MTTSDSTAVSLPDMLKAETAERHHIAERHPIDRLVLVVEHHDRAHRTERLLVPADHLARDRSDRCRPFPPRHRVLLRMIQSRTESYRKFLTHILRPAMRTPEPVPAGPMRRGWTRCGAALLWKRTGCSYTRDEEMHADRAGTPLLRARMDWTAARYPCGLGVFVAWWS